MEAILFGSIGTLVETSELQRQSFNLAFKEVGLDWYWNTATYCKLITEPGGMKRIKNYGENNLSEPEIKNIHALKEKHFAELVPEKLYLRPTVKEVLNYSKDAGLKLGFITTTSQNNIDLIKTGISKQLDFDVFDLVTTVNDVIKPKPDPEVYTYALKALKMSSENVIVVEDTPVNQRCASNAGLKCVLFPGEYAEIPPENRYNTLTYNLIDKLEPELQHV
ncbi:MAG: HAD-IA family hydrolase [Paracoccaceae bacterium]|nr:HAD-IA family hydrolase [Paracoccaceae bacterium]